MSASRRTCLLLVASLVADGLPVPKEIRVETGRAELGFETNAEQAIWRDHLGGRIYLDNTYQPEWREGEIRSVRSLSDWRGCRIDLNSWSPVEAPLPKVDAPLTAKIRAALADDTATDTEPEDGHVYACCGKTGRISRHESWCAGVIDSWTITQPQDGALQ